MPLPQDHRLALTKMLLHINDAKQRARWDYYNGYVAAPFLTAKLREHFGDLAESMVENYCSIAIDARIDRLQVTGFDGPGEDAAQNLWDTGGFRQRQDQMYRWGLVDGSMYLIVQDDIVVANPARVAYAEPATDDWLSVMWAGKAWQNMDHWEAILWDEERLYRYRTAPGSANLWLTQRNWNSSTVSGAMQFVEEEYHGYGQVPVFPANPYGDGASPLLDKIAPIQDRINKIIANTFVTLEWSAFKQRVFFTTQEIDPFDVRQEPDTAIVLDPGTADARSSVVELGGSSLQGYDELKHSTVLSLWTIANLPRHMLVNVGSMVSGDAIKADEGPFIQAIKNHQREFGQAFTAALDLCGIDAEPVWRNPETNNDDIQARTVETLVASGLPWQTAVERYLGFTPDEITAATILKGQETQLQQTALQAQTEAFLTNPLM